MSRKSMVVLSLAIASAANVFADTARVLSVQQVVGRRGSPDALGGTCRPSALGQAGGTAMNVGDSAIWYSVTYEFQGRTYLEALDYHPGSRLTVDANGRPLKVPYDNPA